MQNETEMKKRIKEAYGSKRKTYALILVVLLVAAAAVYFLVSPPAAQNVAKNVADINDTLKSAADAIGSIAKNIK